MTEEQEEKLEELYNILDKLIEEMESCMEEAIRAFEHVDHLLMADVPEGVDSGA